MKLRINHEPMYRYRRASVFFFTLAVLGIPYSLSIFLSYPAWWASLVFSLVCLFGISVSSALLGLHFRNIARDEQEKIQPLLGVVTPIEKK